MAQATHVDSEIQSGVLVATIKAPNVAQYEADVIGDQLQREAPEARWQIAVDLAQVQMLASAGLGMLISLNNAVRANKGRMMVANVRPEILNLLRMTRLDKILPIAKDMDHAIRKLG